MHLLIGVRKIQFFPHHFMHFPGFEYFLIVQRQNRAQLQIGNIDAVAVGVYDV